MIFRSSEKQPLLLRTFDGNEDTPRSRGVFLPARQ